jgi:hypothetical protein
MNLSHDEMMLIIQGLRLINGIDRLDRDYTPTTADQTAARTLLQRIDEETG